MKGYWFNPRDVKGSLGTAFNVAAGTSTFTPPDKSKDWVLWVTDGLHLNRDVTRPSAGATLVQVVVGKWKSAIAPFHKRRPQDQKVHHFGLYDAPQPWGPCTTVYWTDHWEDTPLTAIDAQGHPGAAGGWGESQRIPSKWINADGNTIHLVFSGEDRFKVRRADLTVERE